MEDYGGDKLVEFCPFYLEGIILHSYCLQTMPEQWILNDIGQNHAREPPPRKGPVHHMEGSNSLPGSLFFGRTDISWVWVLQSHSLKQQPGIKRENVLPLYKRAGDAAYTWKSKA